MLTAPLVILAALAWLGLLFGAALWGERRPGAFEKHWRYVYALSLAVYCTSWTFFGTVTQALRSGWAIPPTFVGTIALYLLGFGLLRKLVALARERHSTSLADLIATRLGKSSMLAAAVTLVAVLGIVPYIALQLKAVTMSYGLLNAGVVWKSGGAWTVALQGTNLTDKNYLTTGYVLPTLGVRTGFYGAPRQVSLSVKYEF
jgi:Na+/proline symporter